VGAGSEIMGGDENQVLVITATGAEAWPSMSKQLVAEKLATRIAGYFS